MSQAFREIFDSDDDLTGKRSKYLSRLFGIFSEKVVSVWAEDDRAPFENLGRPTLKYRGESRGHTLDFTFRERSTRLVYVAEMKCEIEYLNFEYFILNSSCQLDHHHKPAFEAFLTSALHPNRLEVRVNRQPIEIKGAILVWGALDPKKKAQIISERGFHDILSIENITRDLVQWRNPFYLDMIETYRKWSNRLFDGLLSTSLLD